MNNFRMKLYQFMQGRYGMDEFGQFLLITAMVFIFASNFVRIRLLYLLGVAMLVYAYVRIVSKNISKRQQENLKFQAIKAKLTRNGRPTSAKNWQRGQTGSTQGNFAGGSQTSQEQQNRKGFGFGRKKKEEQPQYDTENFNYYKCRNCGKIVRVPKGKGKVKISCPECGNSFVDVT